MQYKNDQTHKQKKICILQSVMTSLFAKILHGIVTSTLGSGLAYKALTDRMTNSHKLTHGLLLMSQSIIP